MIDKAELKLNGTPFRLMADGTFMLGDRKTKFMNGKDGLPAVMEIANPDGSITRLTLEPSWAPTAADLAAFSGDWYSEEAQAGITFAVEGDKAFLRQRPTMNFQLRPIYKDHFAAPGGYILWFTRDASGKIDKLHAAASRMRDMPFTRVSR